MFPLRSLKTPVFTITRRSLEIQKARYAKAVESDKVTIIGAGGVGMACAYTILAKRVSSNVVLIDRNEKKTQGELLDLLHGSGFLGEPTVTGSSDFSLAVGSRVCVITAGLRQKPGESRLKLVQKNVDLLKKIVADVAKYAQDSILLIVSNPCDVLTYFGRVFTNFPKNKVIGSGTNLDSNRFRFLLSRRYKTALTSVHGYIIGEHGDSSVPCWSGTNIAGTNIDKLKFAKNIPPLSKDERIAIQKKVVNAAYDIIKLKGYTSWGVGLSVAHICQSLLKNTRTVHPVSVDVKGLHGITQDVYLSLPCVVGKDGIENIVIQSLSEEEKIALQKSAKVLEETMKSVKT